MKRGGYVGKILRLNLTDRKSSTMETEAYQEWVGGHGLGSALFFDLVKDKTISGFDPANIVTLMTSPLSGTLAPGASSRTEVQGIGVQSSPIEWFTRSNFGGRFSSMLKYAGWDGIVIEGQADRPVWVDIRNDEVKFKDAGRLWGMDAWQAQLEIWREVSGGAGDQAWVTLGREETGGRTTQHPAVLAIGQAGERKSRTACLIHDAGNAAGQGGFGGVWGAKNLKAVSVIGSGSIPLADPAGLMKARLWAQEKYALNMNDLERSWFSWFGRRRPQNRFWAARPNARLSACVGCHQGCKERAEDGLGSESTCVETAFYGGADQARHGKQTSAAYLAGDALQKYGINAYEALRGLYYIRDLNKLGVLGPGKQIDCPLDFSRFGEADFAEAFLRLIAFREGVGDDFAEGFYRAAKRWGRLEEDLKSGLLEYPYWGLPEHSYDPRVEVEWGYGTILGDRDINEHDFNVLYWWPSSQVWAGKTPQPPAQMTVEIIASKLEPFAGDPNMLDYSTENTYSEPMAKLVAWHRRYTRFWKQSALFCDQRWPDFINTNVPGYKGLTGEGEPRFFNAVTGMDLTFGAGMELGRRIWNLDNAIWTLQGRHRDMVKFADYIYTNPFQGQGGYAWYCMPGKKNGAWDYIRLNGRAVDRAKFETFKTLFYTLEGWHPESGWPRESTLKTLGLGRAADALREKNRLGQG